MGSQQKWRVTLLGTGSSQGVPSLGGPDGRGDWGRCDSAEPRNRRTRTSALIEGEGGTRILVDAGPDCRAQLLAAGVGSLDAVIFTHAHADHVMGLDELRQINRVTGRALPAFGFPETLAELRNRFAYAFQPPTRGFFRPALTGTEVLPGDRIDIGEFSLSLFEQDHRVMRTLGLRLLDFGYSTDVATLGEASLGMLTGLDTWVVGCFQLESHPIHAGLADVAGWVSQLKPRRTVLTHMSSAMDWASLQRVLPKGVEPGFDLLQLEPVDLLQLEPGG